MEYISTLILQIYGHLVLPLILPMFICAILFGMKSPEKLLDLVFELTASLSGAVFSGVFKVLSSIFKALAKVLTAKKKTGGRRPSPKPKPKPDSDPEQVPHPKPTKPKPRPEPGVRNTNMKNMSAQADRFANTPRGPQVCRYCGTPSRGLARICTICRGAL